MLKIYLYFTYAHSYLRLQVMLLYEHLLLILQTLSTSHHIHHHILWQLDSRPSLPLFHQLDLKMNFICRLSSFKFLQTFIFFFLSIEIQFFHIGFVILHALFNTELRKINFFLLCSQLIFSEFQLLKNVLLRLFDVIFMLTLLLDVVIVNFFLFLFFFL